jgi:hypothetical protein
VGVVLNYVAVQVLVASLHEACGRGTLQVLVTSLQDVVGVVLNYVAVQVLVSSLHEAGGRGT